MKIVNGFFLCYLQSGHENSDRDKIINRIVV